MKQIDLTQGKVAMVDDEDYEWLNQWKWHAIKARRDNFYAVRADYTTGKQMRIWMHRLLLNIDDKNIFGDHADRNGLNNQRNNIRISEPSQNSANGRSRVNSSSKYLGVHLWANNYKYKGKIKVYKYWKATICKNYKLFYLGLFKSEIDAAIAYNKAAFELHGEFANLNVIQ